MEEEFSEEKERRERGGASKSGFSGGKKDLSLPGRGGGGSLEEGKMVGPTSRSGKRQKSVWRHRRGTLRGRKKKPLQKTWKGNALTLTKIGFLCK